MSSEQKHKKIQSELAVFNDTFRNYLIDAPTPWPSNEVGNVFCFLKKN